MGAFPVRFSCTQCGNCCRFTGERKYVFVSIREARRIVAYSGLSWAEATERDLNGRLSLKCLPEGDGMACRFLRGNECSIYDVRPKQCRSFPFWPQNLESREAWEAVPCEGIGQGPLIHESELVARLRGRELPGCPV